MRCCWQKCPEDRPMFEQIVKVFTDLLMFSDADFEGNNVDVEKPYCILENPLTEEVPDMQETDPLKPPSTSTLELESKVWRCPPSTLTLELESKMWRCCAVHLIGLPFSLLLQTQTHFCLSASDETLLGNHYTVFAVRPLICWPFSLWATVMLNCAKAKNKLSHYDSAFCLHTLLYVSVPAVRLIPHPACQERSWQASNICCCLELTGAPVFMFSFDCKLSRMFLVHFPAVCVFKALIWRMPEADTTNLTWVGALLFRSDVHAPTTSSKSDQASSFRHLQPKILPSRCHWHSLQAKTCPSGSFDAFQTEGLFRAVLHFF